ncbi:DNA-directed RNA polymerase subunit beta [Ornithinibacillus xuwenensis]|uniref:DNA-directed RNA polymerase subunit beta n=1 Tax=Ornithinibacillus xuwenensis TaxID=3144668 RepID=A0ABU9XGB7_9BACI
MSTTNQMEKTKEEVTAKQAEASPKRKKAPIEQPVATKKSKKPSDKPEKEKNQKDVSAKESKRKKSASAEIEMTETLAQTRKQQKKKQKEEKRKNKTPRLRIFPIWLRIIIVAALSVVALFSGLMIGYGGLGDGEPKDALKWETWQHIIDIVVKEE